ncbi:hypothetical protein D3C80_1833580 [compost metagenome]
MAQRLADGATYGVGVGAVGLDGEGTAAGRFDASYQLGGFVRRAYIGDGHSRTFVGQALGDGGADAPRAALDQGDFASEVVTAGSGDARHARCSD